LPRWRWTFAAIGQKNIKRLMAYSSIGHMGFALVGLAAGTAEGAQGVLVYIAIYVSMTLGSFAVILTMKRNNQHVENISDLAGLSRTNPLLAFVFAIAAVFAGGHSAARRLLRKILCIVAAIKAGLFTLAVIGVVTSVGRRILLSHRHQVMYFDEPLVQLDPMRMELRTVWRSLVSSTSSFLSIRAAGEHGDGRGKVIILDGILARSSSQLGRLPARRLRSYRLGTNAEAMARGARWRARTDVVRDIGADGGREGGIAPGSRLVVISPAASSKVVDVVASGAPTLGFAAGVRWRRRCRR